MPKEDANNGESMEPDSSGVKKTNRDQKFDLNYKDQNNDNVFTAKESESATPLRSSKQAADANEKINIAADHASSFNIVIAGPEENLKKSLDLHNSSVTFSMNGGIGECSNNKHNASIRQGQQTLMNTDRDQNPFTGFDHSSGR